MTRKPPVQVTRTQTRKARRVSPVLPLALTALLLGGGYVGATALFSNQTQDTAQKAVGQLTAALTASGKVRVEQSDYRKGFKNSTQTMTLALTDFPAENGQPLRVVVTNHIQHGPVLGAAGLGQALIDTELRFSDPEMQAAYDKAFSSQKPTIRTLVGLTGGSTTDLKVPGGKSAEGDVSWQALTGQLEVAGLNTTSRLHWAGMAANSDSGLLTVGPVDYSGTLRRENSTDPLGVGTSTLTLSRVEMLGEEKLTLSGLKVTSLSERAGEFQNVGARYEIAEVEKDGQKFQNLRLGLRFDHLARAPLLSLTKTVQDMQQSIQAKSGEVMTPEQGKKLESDVLALLKAGPVLKLEELAVGQPGRGMSLAGQLSMPGAAGLTTENWQMMAGPQAMSLLDADFKLTTSEQGLRELTSAVGGTAPDPQMLLESGQLRREGNNLVTTFALKDGQMLVNGEPMQ